MKNFEKQYSNIRLVKVQNNEAFWEKENVALTLGIKSRKKRIPFIHGCQLLPDFERMDQRNELAIHDEQNHRFGLWRL